MKDLLIPALSFLGLFFIFIFTLIGLNYLFQIFVYKKHQKFLSLVTKHFSLKKSSHEKRLKFNYSGYYKNVKIKFHYGHVKPTKGYNSLNRGLYETHIFLISPLLKNIELDSDYKSSTLNLHSDLPSKNNLINKYNLLINKFEIEFLIQIKNGEMLIKIFKQIKSEKVSNFIIECIETNIELINSDILNNSANENFISNQSISKVIDEENSDIKIAREAIEKYYIPFHADEKINDFLKSNMIDAVRTIHQLLKTWGVDENLRTLDWIRLAYHISIIKYLKNIREFLLKDCDDWIQFSDNRPEQIKQGELVKSKINNYFKLSYSGIYARCHSVTFDQLIECKKGLFFSSIPIEKVSPKVFDDCYQEILSKLNTNTLPANLIWKNSLLNPDHGVYLNEYYVEMTSENYSIHGQIKEHEPYDIPDYIICNFLEIELKHKNGNKIRVCFTFFDGHPEVIGLKRMWGYTYPSESEMLN